MVIYKTFIITKFYCFNCFPCFSIQGNRPIKDDLSKQPTFKKYVDILEKEILLNNVSYVKNGIHVVRTLKGNEKWLMFAYIHGENREVLVSHLFDITNIKLINKVITER